MNIPRLTAMLLIGLLALTGCQTLGGKPDYAAAAKIDREVDSVLHNLYDKTPSARGLVRQAKGVLVFPGVVKAGFIGGAQYGTGALRKGGRTVGYYNLVAGSYGLQAGFQSFDYVLLFMTRDALDYLNRSEGWEIGVGPSIVVVDTGVAKTLTTTTAKSDVYAFILDQRGLMAGLGIQGSKITRVEP